MKLFFTLLPIFIFSFELNAQTYPEMILIEGREFTVGTNIDRDVNVTYDQYGDSRYLYEEVDANIDDFEISRTEITFSQFNYFVRETGYKTLHQRRLDNPENYWDRFDDVDNFPMHFITPFDALAYCQWLSKMTGDIYRLPTEAEWELAARGDSNAKYPWGNEFVDIASEAEVNAVQSTHFEVDRFPIDTTDSGLNGMTSGGEITFDVFGYNEPSIRIIQNPLNTIGSEFVQKGAYNGYYYPSMGFFTRNSSSFRNNISPNQTFRIIREITRTIFNSNLQNPSVYWVGVGKIINNNVRIRTQPDESFNALTEIEIGSSVYITLKNTTEDERWYRVYAEHIEPFIGGSTIAKGYLGWVKSDDIELISDNWYE